MAIDSRDKRAVIVYAMFNPDGTIAAADRPHILWTYRGFDFAVVFGEATVTNARSRSYQTNARSRSYSTNAIGYNPGG